MDIKAHLSVKGEIHRPSENPSQSREIWFYYYWHRINPNKNSSFSLPFVYEPEWQDNLGHCCPPFTGHSHEKRFPFPCSVWFLLINLPCSTTKHLRFTNPHRENILNNWLLFLKVPFPGAFYLLFIYLFIFNDFHFCSWIKPELKLNLSIFQ